MTLPRKRDRPRRTEHPVRPAWEAEAERREEAGEPSDDIAERLTPEYRAIVEQVKANAGGRCEAQLDGCVGQGCDPHHVFPVEWGGAVAVPVRWLRWVCRPCHGRIHNVNHWDDDDVFARGLLVPKSRPRRPELS